MWLTMGKPHSNTLQTLTTGSIIWCRRRMRLLIGWEKCALQGFCYNDVELQNRELEDGKLSQLSGDSFNLYVLTLVWFCFFCVVSLPSAK